MLAELGHRFAGMMLAARSTREIRSSDCQWGWTRFEPSGWWDRDHGRHRRACRSLAGSILLSMMSNLLNLLDVYVYYQYILRGLILCGALVLYQIRRQGGKAK